MHKPETAVIVTGAAGGIGSVICNELVSAGYQVIGVDKVTRTHEPGHAWLQFDLRRLCGSDDGQRKFQAGIRELAGEYRIYSIINNAAVQKTGSLEVLSLEDIRETLDVNLLVPMIITRLFLDDLKKTRGRVINIGSVHANVTKKGFSAYAMSKSGLAGMSRGMAVELGEFGICVNCVQPGAVNTPMLEAGFVTRPGTMEELQEIQPLKRIGTPRDISGLVKYLLSEDSSYITGACLTIDGGITACLHDPL